MSQSPEIRRVARLRAAAKHLLLLPILVAAAALRLFGLNWDAGQHLHPDERFIAIVEGKIGLPTSIGAYFDTAHSPLNPYNNGFDGFAYGTLPLFLSRWLGEMAGFSGYDRVIFLGRPLSALADLGTVVFVYALANLLYGRRAALAASAVAAFSVLEIQLSHFFAFDTFLTFFVAWSLYFAHRTWMTGRWWNAALLGLGVGFATACKISAITLAPIVVLACVLPWPGRPLPALAGLGGRLVIAGLSTLLAYRLTEPYAFLGSSPLDFRPNPKFIADMSNWVKISSGEIEVPYMIQWAGTPKYTFALESILRWGLGPAAGLAVLGGLALAAWRLRRWDHGGRHLLLVLWTLLNLVYFGGQFAKFMRYLLPVYPALAVLGGYFLDACWQVARRHSPLQGAVGWLTGRLVGLLPVLILLLTIFWSLAFVQIYDRPNTRVAASLWLMENLPSGAVLANEHWDDELPLGLPGRESKAFRHLSMNLYDDENPEKLSKLLDNLNRADFLVLASNRLYGSIPRLPTRYPLASEYYRVLFDGRLGYELVAEFTSRPALLGLEINDDRAQEDFTVYDHPKVQIFQRGPNYDPGRVAAILGSVPLDQVERVKPVEGAAVQRPVLTPNEWETVQQRGTWSALFDRRDIANRFAPLVWWLTATVLGLLVWPLLWGLTPHLADRGYSLARTLGVLVVAYGAWLLASLRMLEFSRQTLLLVAAPVALGSLLVVSRSWPALRSHLRIAWPVLLASEAAFTIGFGICLGMRLVNPDLWHANYGGEKPMDFAFLNAVIKSDFFPAYDPWFSGGLINYYYFGFVLVAALVKLTGMVPSVAYNLALALWFGLVCQTAFSAGSNLLLVRRDRGRRWTRASLVAGWLAVLFVAFAGNLDGLMQTRDALWKAAGVSLQSGIPLLGGAVRTVAGLLALARGARTPEFDFWRSTRLIGPEDPGPIHEFPFFSFLYADLHAHSLALPITLVVLTLSVEIARSHTFRGLLRWPPGGWAVPAGEMARLGGLLVAVALSVGALRATNTWDFPTYLAVVLIGLGCAFRLLVTRQLGRAIVGVLVCGGLVLASSSLFYAPYLQRYQLFYAGVEPVKSHTAMGQWLTIHGQWLFVVASFVVLAWPRRAALRREIVTARLQASRAYYGLALPWAEALPLSANWQLAAAALLVLCLGLAGVGLSAFALALALGGALLALGWLRRRSEQTLFACGLGLVALLVAGAPEIVAIKGDIGRMNTVFKFYYQAWTLLAVVCAAWTVRLVVRVRQLREIGVFWRRVWLAAAVCLFASTLIYPLRGAPARLMSRLAPLPMTLDGMAFMEHAAYKDKDQDVRMLGDYEAIRWLQDNVAGSPVVLEANTGLYKWGSRVSIYTGLPSVIGWDWHEKQQRVGMAPAVDERLKDVKTIFETPRLDQALSLLRKYNVAYIYVGGLERIYYPAEGLRKFEQAPSTALQAVYEESGVTIYRVLGVS